MKAQRILAINPGSTSTKVAVYEGTDLLKELTLRHSTEEISQFDSILDQFGFRKEIIMNAVVDAGVEIGSLSAVIGRGGLVKPISSGVYIVNDALKADLRESAFGQHASNLGGLIAAEIAESIGVPAYIADPVVVDELQDVARYTGIPEIERISIFHALNQKAMARIYAEKQGVEYESLNLIVAHLGGGISVGAHRKGQVVDVNNALNGDGPMSPERAGTVPAAQLAELCFSGKYTLPQIKKMLTGNGGLVAYLANNHVGRIYAEVEKGDKKAALMLHVMAYTIGKYIGEMATVLHGKVDAIILTGGIAHNDLVNNYIEEMVRFIAPVHIMAGENELEALAMNALRVLNGKQTPKEYK